MRKSAASENTVTRNTTRATGVNLMSAFIVSFHFYPPYLNQCSSFISIRGLPITINWAIARVMATLYFWKSAKTAVIVAKRTPAKTSQVEYFARGRKIFCLSLNGSILILDVWLHIGACFVEVLLEFQYVGRMRSWEIMFTITDKLNRNNLDLNRTSRSF